MSDTDNVGAFVLGAPTSPRVLVRHADLLAAYADGTLAEGGEDREAYLSHFAFGEEMRTHYEQNRHSVAGYAGPCWCRWLHLDIDRPDLAAALADARRLAGFLAERYGTDPPVWFSGSKGFHVAVELAHRPPPAVGFPAVAKAFAEGIARAAGVAIDLAVYDRNHIIRLPNTRHPKTGLFKRRIDADDLLRLDIEGIRRHAAHQPGTASPRGTGIRIDWRQTGRRRSLRPTVLPRPGPRPTTTSGRTHGHRATSSTSFASEWLKANGTRRCSAVRRGSPNKARPLRSLTLY
jgi:hypothetical protein